MLKERRMTTVCIGLSLALLFVIVRGCNSANFFMAKRELPDMGLIAVTSIVSAVVAFAFSLLFEKAEWGKVLKPSSVSWTLIAGCLSVVSVYAALRSYDFIPQWLTQAFIGLEPLFGLIGLVIVSVVVADSETKHMLLARKPSNWWLFGGGLVLLISGVFLMALSKAHLGSAEPGRASERGGVAASKNWEHIGGPGR
jgi:hypothetical protein